MIKNKIKNFEMFSDNAFFPIFFMFFSAFFYHISLTVKDFIEIPIVTEARDRLLEAEILCQKITLISEFRKNIENEKHFIASKSFTVREKKRGSSIFDIINTSCNFQQNWSKDVVMNINGLSKKTSLATYAQGD